ncbi:hypothetical protein [Marasmitruncus massiliensis]|uniref:hypothetical protein n=1 Tax=Marasmitruncus massiliensis TaxID=1944642 RepID=UPI000C7DBF46|nr:hypothetical protein [Marasmitruncus massiliensis]
MDNELLQAMKLMLEENNKTLVNQFNAIIETKVLPEIYLIAEQHGDIIQKLQKADEIDDVKDRVRNLERSVTAHTSQIAELKKAQ